MLTIFNRAELLTTLDRDRFDRARDALEAAGIDCRCRIKDLASRSHSQGRDGAFGIDQDVRMEYTLYVRKDQLDWARTFL